MHRSLDLAALLLLTGCTSLANYPAVQPASSIAVTAEVSIGEGNHPVVSISIRNLSASPVAICRCFGPRAGWIHLDIKQVTGEIIRGPEIDFFELPPYDCLAPGALLSLETDLAAWSPTMGGRELTGWGVFSYSLQPGTYSLRASYRDNGPQVSRKCASIDGEAASEWIRFEVVGEDIAAAELPSDSGSTILPQNGSGPLVLLSDPSPLESILPSLYRDTGFTGPFTVRFTIQESGEVSLCRLLPVKGQSTINEEFAAGVCNSIGQRVYAPIDRSVDFEQFFFSPHLG
jgi:hypothetical protein